MNLRVKQAALLKLAQVKLAATHVLRQRAMQKQAEEGKRVRIPRTPEEIEKLKAIVKAKPLPILTALNGIGGGGIGMSLGAMAGGVPGGILGAALGGLGGAALGRWGDYSITRPVREGAQKVLDSIGEDGTTEEYLTPQDVENIRKELEYTGPFSPDPVSKDYARRVLQAYENQ